MRGAKMTTETQVFRSTQRVVTENYLGAKTTSTDSRSFIGTRSGTKVLGWRDKIRHLESATGAYSRKVYEIKPGSWFVSSTYGDKLIPHIYGTERFSGTGHTVNVADPTLVSSAVSNTALGNFLSNASAVQRPFKGGVFLGEFRETLRMLRRPASALRDGIHDYLKRARRRIRQEKGKPAIKKMLADSWLEYAYGWKPLMGDIESAVKAYSTYQARVETLRVYGKATWESKGTASYSAVDKAPGMSSVYYRVRTTTNIETHKCVYKGAVRVQVSGVDVDAASKVIELSGFNLLEFIPTVWELVPYSFVIDYFTNVGNILNSVAGLYSDWVWVSLSTKATRLSEYQIEGVRQEPQYRIINWESRSDPGYVKVIQFDRTNPSLSLPTFQFELPSSPWVWGNLLALLVSKTGSS